MCPKVGGVIYTQAPINQGLGHKKRWRRKERDKEENLEINEVT